jgi:signal transduction histidine kinase
VTGDLILLKFTDNGIGIDLEKFGKRLFGMYQTFHGNEDAKGIGLFLTKNQLTAMGDEISVNSTLGSGSTFQISFHKKLS